jgi:hypothetical protein
MFDLGMDELRVHFEGKYDDVFLYGDELILINDDALTFVDYAGLIKSLTEGYSTDVKAIARYALYRNDFFYDKTSALYDFFQLSYVRKGLFRAFKKLKKIEIGKRLLKKHTNRAYPNIFPGVLHLEVYNHNVFVSNDNGTFLFKYAYSDKNKSQLITTHSAVNMSALYGNEIKLACAHGGLKIVEFENLKLDRAVSKIDHVEEYQSSPIMIESAYQDFLVRNIDDSYEFRLNSIWDKQTGTKENSPQEKAAAYKKIDLVSTEGDDVLSALSFATAAGNRLITIKNSKTQLFTMNYKYRTEEIPNLFKEDEVPESAPLYTETVSWKTPNNISKTRVYSGHQTVFGLVIDTDNGTYVIDDKLDEQHRSFEQELKVRLISKGENLKVRHFYRARNYSHVIANIKDDHVELYSDLTDYFFPKKNKKIRLNGRF